jgi:arginyl-tRNA synthetase
MIRAKENISKELLEILKQLGSSKENVLVELPQDSEHGDLTSNVAMQMSKELGVSPREIAEKIVERFPQVEYLEKIEVAGPGFLNFYLSNDYLLKIIKDTIEEKTFKLEMNSGKKCMVEYTDPNPFKILHIGHLYTNMIGESFARLQEALGAQVYRANYQGDVGLHVAKTMYGLEILFKEEGISFNDLKERNLVKRVEYLGQAYMLGFNRYDDLKEENAISRVKNINYYIFSLYIPSLERKGYFSELEGIGMREWYMEGKEWCLEYFEKIYERTGSKFDNYYLESEMANKGLELVLENTSPSGKGIFEKDQGSVIYRGDESKGLHTRVFINSEGLPTYEAKELALAFKKFEDIELDESVMITADEQSGYFKVVLDALSQLDSEIASKSKHFPHGMVKLPGAEKMSSRKGKIIGGEWLLDETQKKVSTLMKSTKEWSDEEVSEVSDRIAVAAIKYAFLKVSVGKDVVFDFDKSISFDGDTGPYLLYVYARCKSLLDGQDQISLDSRKELGNAFVKSLVREISKYQDVLLGSSVNYSPSTLCSYLFVLGQTFNSFYQNVRVLESEEKEFLLSVVGATSKVMKHGLAVLGIEVVERM